LNLLLLLALLSAPSAPAAPPAEARVVEYLKANVRPGEPVVVSRLYNEVFTAPEERAALDRLFDTFFKIPLFAARQQKTAGRPPTLAEIGEQFHFLVPGQAALMLRIMESDPRMPRFLARDARTGEITSVDVEAILAHPRFGKALERSIAGWEGRPAPAFETTTDSGQPLRSADLAGTPHLVYFWFTGCPPCVRTSPLLARLDRAYAPKGFRVVGLNADAALELPYTAADRQAYAAAHGLGFAPGVATPALLEAYGGIGVFPTIFVVDAKGTVVRQLVNAPDEAALEAAIRRALP
jgi:thiol-disulfide isomerase/thioredoxin